MKGGVTEVPGGTLRSSRSCIEFCYMDISTFIRFTAEEHLYQFQCKAIMQKVAANILIAVFKNNCVSLGI